VRQQGNELLDSALAQLEDAGVAVADVSPGDDDTSDALLKLSFPNRICIYEVQLKSRISPASAHAKRPSPGRRALLVAPYISDKVGETLRKGDVHYVDSLGNMYLRGDGLLLDVRGRRGPTTQPGTPGHPLRAFKSSGLKVIFALLADPEMITASYREIARVSGVSLGTVHWVVNELETAGYASPDPRRLHRTRHLLDRWVEAYTFDLWPRLTLATFDAADPDWWKRADDALRASGAQWGGETAAHWINPRLKPRRTIIYAPDIPKELAMQYRFRKVEGEGGVEIRHLFWHLPTDSSPTVPTPLIYGDLIASGDPRLAEAATDLRENDALLQRLERG